ncbi:MAG: hypothetical protein ACPGYK_03950 [Flavobacteriales bacterium]
MNRKWKGILISQMTMCILLAPEFTQGQGSLATDRPTESAAATLLPVGLGRAELGGIMNWLTEDASGAQSFTYAAPLGILRYGISHAVELRAGARFSQQVGAVDDAMLGAKLNLPGDFWGEVDACYLIELNINPNKLWSPEQPIPSVHRLCLGTSWNTIWSITANAGWLRNAGESTWMASWVLGRELGVQGWSGFIESHAYTGETPQANFGFQRQIENDMQLDVVFGRNLGGDIKDFTVGMGLSLTLTGETTHGTIRAKD